MILEYCMTHPNVVPPTRSNPSDAGLDIYFSPLAIDAEVALEPGQSTTLKTGLRFGIPHGYMLQVMNRGSVASLRKLIVGACVVDSGYDGEVFINLHNIGTETQIIKHGDKIAQAVLIPVVHFRAYCRHDGALYDYPITMSERGDGALGSTDAPTQRKSILDIDEEKYKHLTD